MYTYTIKGHVNYNEAETEEGYATIEIDEIIEMEELGAQEAKDKFFEENTQYDDFFGSAKTCDKETHGKKGASFIYQNNPEITLDVDLAE